MSDWDERFASLQRRFRERIDQTVPKGDPIGFAEPIEFVLIRDARDLAREARALLAQREAEIEALRETVHGVRELVTLFNHTAVYDLKSDILAALSDNQEGQDGSLHP